MLRSTLILNDQLIDFFLILLFYISYNTQKIKFVFQRRLSFNETEQQIHLVSFTRVSVTIQW